MALLETILSFIVLVGILVFVHELGHFLTARWSGMRADVFAVGMGPRLLGWNRKTGFSFGKIPENLDLEGGTDYRLAAFPIGGYVKIAGMVDESLDTEFAARPPQPWEFRSKGTLAKTIVISAGVIMNILLAIGIYTALAFFVGTDYQATTTVGALMPANPIYKAGLREGDRITAVNGQRITYFDAIADSVQGLGTDGVLQLSVARGDTAASVSLTGAMLTDTNFVLPPEHMAVRVNSTVDGGPADRAGIEEKDLIVAADGVPMTSDRALTAYIQAHAQQPISFSIMRDGAAITKSVTPNKEKRIEVAPQSAYNGLKHHQSFPLGESVTIGLGKTWHAATGIFTLVGKLVTGQARLRESIGGPVMIAQISRSVAHRGLDQFIELMATLSVTLACMNILPIPALDGGHLVFILIEGIMRREVPLKIRMAVQQVGFALLVIFMIFVVYNDVARLLK